VEQTLTELPLIVEPQFDGLYKCKGRLETSLFFASVYECQAIETESKMTVIRFVEAPSSYSETKALLYRYGTMTQLSPHPNIPQLYDILE
jgi:hypothetical protein